jgi:hypothetical protein
MTKQKHRASLQLHTLAGLSAFGTSLSTSRSCSFKRVLRGLVPWCNWSHIDQSCGSESSLLLRLSLKMLPLLAGSITVSVLLRVLVALATGTLLGCSVFSRRSGSSDN